MRDGRRLTFRLAGELPVAALTIILSAWAGNAPRRAEVDGEVCRLARMAGEAPQTGFNLDLDANTQAAVTVSYGSER